jgi:hypothetical protein
MMTFLEYLGEFLSSGRRKDAIPLGVSPINEVSDLTHLFLEAV